jgi:hypothetical protein
MTEQPKFVPPEAASWRPPYLPPLPPLADPWPVADCVPAPALPEAAALAPDETAPPLPPGAPVTPSPPAVALTPEVPGETAPSREKGERVELHGYVAGMPWFGTDRSGVLTCVFPLATHPEPETTVTFRVRAKRERAEKLRGTLRRGDAVLVVGYLHREVFRRGDTERISEIVNLTALKKPTGDDQRK